MLSSLRVSHRLLLGFGLIITMLVIVTVMGIDEVDTIDKKMTTINDVNSVKQRYAINFRGSVHDRAIAIRDVVLLDSLSEVQSVIREINQLANFYKESASPMERMLATDSTPQERKMMQRIKEIETYTLPLVKQIITLRLQGNRVDSKEILLTRAKPAFIDWLAAINAFIDYQEQQNQVKTDEVRTATGAFTGVMIVATTIAILIAILVTWLFIAYFKRQLGGEPHEIAEILHTMANGKIGNHVESKHSGSVLHSLSRLQHQLNSTVKGINHSADSITRQSQTESDSSGNLDFLASQQSSQSANVIKYMESVRTEAALVENLLSQTEQISVEAADTSADGKEAVSHAANEIRSLAETVKMAVDNIRKLEKRTQEISGITNTISGISEQTNLLALNAAIEAARAGESGRGFAVVADEVRSLASRTGEATAEISSMLNEVQAETSVTMEIMSSSIPQVEGAIELSDKSSNLLQIIEEQAKQSLDNVNQVVSASTKQISTLNALNDGLNEVIATATAMGDSSMSLYEQNQLVAKKLSSLAKELKQHTDYFTTQ